MPEIDAGERRAIRERFGIGLLDSAFVYSGSLASWQCARETVRLFRGVRELAPAAKLALLVHDRAEGERLLAAEGVPGRAETLAPREAALALRAFDAAFLLRKRDPVNEVSCPVKFAEYLHAGLAVILTEGIGDASVWTREHGLGVVLPDEASAENASRVAAGIRGFGAERCRAFARERLVFERTAARYEEAYGFARRHAR